MPKMQAENYNSSTKIVGFDSITKVEQSEIPKGVYPPKEGRGGSRNHLSPS